MTQLRLENGVELQKLSAIVNKNTWEKWIHETKSSVKKWNSSGHLLQTDSNLILTQEGRWFADAITADLMLAEED
jgi:coproporphyrinogen III oxidase-like Fe-S oxidoreductase